MTIIEKCLCTVKIFFVEFQECFAVPDKNKEKRMFSNEIQELLELKGWTQVQLAKELQVHESTISLWIHEERKPSNPVKILLRQWLDEARKESRKQPA